MSEWPTVPLLEVCRAYQPQTIGRKDMIEDGPFPVYGANGVIGRYHSFNHDESQVLLGCRGSCGSVNVSEAQSWVTGNAMVIKPRDSRLSKEFLRYFLDGSEEIAKTITGVAQPQITQKSLAPVSIPLPPSEEQRRIVAVLDEAFAAIATATANAEKNLANARELFSSELRHLFRVAGASWDWRPIGEVADARLGKMLDKAKNRGVPRPYLRNLNVRWFRFDLDDLLEMPFEETETERYSAKRGDLMIVEGGYPGRSAIWDSDAPIFFQKAIHRVRFEDPRLAKLLMYMLFAQDGDGTLSKHFTGAGIQHLTGQALARILMPIPPVEARHGIISKIEAMLGVSEDAQRLYERKLAELASLRQSLLRHAFAGELTHPERELVPA